MTEALQVYWPACDVITGSRVWVTVKLMSVANTLSPGPISSTVGDTARYGISVTVHCTVCESPAVTAESPGEIITSRSKRSGGRKVIFNMQWSSVAESYIHTRLGDCMKFTHTIIITFSA